eukprot:TRINITY_DN14178_c0_g1_i3.p1 TRINITY_DN14178_c0_g1~~TRINITY_DN14178_c0_g1_i3.p1  ORF type:complete len:613 (-),score=105.30 TRINITY_DN14178_c0_g1_i3:264-2102(-)
MEKIQDIEEESRGNWGSRVAFLMACIGYAVGLGNIWRFPFNVYKSGGGAFMVPYVIMLFMCGIPLLFMELAVGQYTRRGPIGALGKLCPLLKGAGVGTVIISFFLSTYYNVILAWTLFYLGSSFQDPLPWMSCENEWNTESCYSVYGNTTIPQEYETSPGCDDGLDSDNCTISFIPAGNVTSSSTQEFFDHRVLGLTEGITEMGNLRLELFGLLFLAWVIVYLCLWKGVALTGKIVQVTALVPCLLLIAFAIRGVTLPGADKGLIFFFKPDWSKIGDPKVWVNAASQVFNSIGIAFGSLIAFSSYNKFKGPVLRDTLIVTFVDAVVSMVCGIAVFSVLGNLAHEQGKEVNEVVTEGPGLVFVVFPYALSKMPLPQVWSVIFFTMLLFLGIDSQFATVEVIITSLKDGFKDLEDKLGNKILVLIVCATSFACGIPHVFEGGIYTFTLVDFYSATISLMFIALFETIAIVWFYGADRLGKNIEDMTGMRPSCFFIYSWQYTTPLMIFVIWIFTLVDYSSPSYDSGNYEYPWWCLIIGWLITGISLLAIPLVGILQIWRTNGVTFVEKLNSSIKSRIKSCPCCGTKLDRNLQAHNTSSTNLIGQDSSNSINFDRV